ncbi:GAF domain-containing protein [Pseudonocardia sp. K10HN5]|uniref:GAF domain-containing protein n=2 Tax=Pseudonocardia acidicola TaxID=2724939 RepID=A0ABX1S4D5_9PSEU|nr:GAF domain-containing protein [Pseudonocardia acidicola]
MVYRAPMRSRRDGVPPGVDRALAEGLCGVGGTIDPAPDDLDDAIARVAAGYAERTAARLGRFAEVPDGAFVWTRGGDGDYHLGRLAGPWRYDGSAAARAVDLVHVRDCTWTAVPGQEVPAGTVRAFARGGRNFQRIHDNGMGAQSLAVWERWG